MSLPRSTKRLVKERPGASYELKEVPIDPPQGDELLVKVGKVALCGTDISLYQWNHGEEGPRLGRGGRGHVCGLAWRLTQLV